MIAFDWSVSLGSLIIAASNVMVVGLAVWRLGIRFATMERKVNLMFAWFLRQISGKLDAMTEDELKGFFDAQYKARP